MHAVVAAQVGPSGVIAARGYAQFAPRDPEVDSAGLTRALLPGAADDAKTASSCVLSLSFLAVADASVQLSLAVLGTGPLPSLTGDPVQHE